jgi:hypothetical protein
MFRWIVSSIEVQKQNVAWIFKCGDYPVPRRTSASDPEIKFSKYEKVKVSTGANRFHVAAARGDLDSMENMLMSEVFSVQVPDKVLCQGIWKRECTNPLRD